MDLEKLQRELDEDAQLLAIRDRLLEDDHIPTKEELQAQNRLEKRIEDWTPNDPDSKDKSLSMSKVNAKGYLIGADGKPLHRTICAEAHGEIPKGWHVHHINHKKKDNRPINLIALPKIIHFKAHENTSKNDYIPRGVLESWIKMYKAKYEAPFISKAMGRCLETLDTLSPYQLHYLLGIIETKLEGKIQYLGTRPFGTKKKRKKSKPKKKKPITKKTDNLVWVKRGEEYDPRYK